MGGHIPTGGGEDPVKRASEAALRAGILITAWSPVALQHEFQRIALAEAREPDRGNNLCSGIRLYRMAGRPAIYAAGLYGARPLGGAGEEAYD